MTITRYILIAILLSLLSVKGYYQKSLNTKDGFEITGRFKGLTEGEKVSINLLEIDVHNNYNIVPLSSTTVKNGEFFLEGFAPEPPRALLIEVHNRALPIHVNNNEKLFITSLQDEDINSYKHSTLENWVKIDGSITANAAFMLMKPTISYKFTISQINGYLKSVKDSIGFQPAIVEAMINAKEIAAKSYFMNYICSNDMNIKPARFQFIDALFDWSYGQHSPFLMEAYKLATDQEKQSYFGKKLKKWASLSIGQVFPTFTLPDIEGRMISLSDIVAKSKLVIVHFWATNSTKSRADNEKELFMYYKKYHDKGLNIVGISADTLDYVWKGFVKSHPEQNSWYNVSDLKGNQAGGIIQDLYLEGGHKIPNTTNVLINSKGEIVAWLDADGHQSSLELQYYLSKIFEH